MKLGIIILIKNITVLVVSYKDQINTKYLPKPKQLRICQLSNNWTKWAFTPILLLLLL